ncbi:MAG TPA: hypothetical protein VN673_17365 [Clostridia bacterium]|nr:hypothetical protein [Clostridia bacterium]
MEEAVPFASRAYGILLAVLFVSRGMDFLSTWVATPRLVLEGNPIAKKLGWKWGIPINVLLCGGFAMWPLPAIVISTTSLLVAARNFQSAWLMRSMGEHAYRDWYVDRVQQTPITLYLSCLAGNTLLFAGIGIALIVSAVGERTLHIIPFGIGLGLIAYAGAVVLFTMLSVWRLRRADSRRFGRSASRRDAVQEICPPVSGDIE